MTNSGKQSANNAIDSGSVVPLVRGPGRPPGTPKTGGRAKGTPNRITRTIKEMAQPYGKRAFTRLAKLLKSDDEKVALAAAKELLDRGFGRSIATTEISGPDGGPLQAGADVNPIELARRIAFALFQGAKASEAAKPSPVETATPCEAPQAVVNGHVEPLPTQAPEEKIEATAHPQAPLVYETKHGIDEVFVGPGQDQLPTIPEPKVEITTARSRRRRRR